MPDPPVGRPPTPPVTSPPERSGMCFSGYGDRDLLSFLEEVRDVIRYEWDRQRGRPPADLALQELLLSELMSAMRAGRVVPGFYRDMSDGLCWMDWASLACWAQWYSSLPDEVARAVVLAELRVGNPFPWIETKSTSQPTARQFNWPAPPNECDPEDPVKGCCPSTVWGDPRYDVDRNQYPGDKKATESSTVSGVVLAAGIVLVVATTALALRSVRSSAEPA